MANQNGDTELHRLEREAEEARARLQVTIAEIKDPQTIENAKHEATDQAMKVKDQVVGYIMEAKDNAIGQVKDTSQRQTSEFARKLQHTAVENPVPVLLIGAGIGWHLYKKPPITTVLLAAGVYGLVRNWNGSADERLWRDPYAQNAPRGYVPGGVAGYGYDEVTDVSSATDRAKVAATRASYQAENAYAQGRQSADDLASNVKDSLREAGQNLAGQIGDAYSAATDRVQDLARTAAGKAQPAVDAVRPAVDRVRPLFDEDHRTQLGILVALGGAGIVAGTLLRSTETGRRWSEQASESIRDTWDHTRDRATYPPRETVARAAEHRRHLRDAAYERAAHWRERGSEYGRYARDASADHPMLLSVLGLALGAVVGGMIRPTGFGTSGHRSAGGFRETARQAIRETTDQVAARASGLVEGVKDATGLGKTTQSTTASTTPPAPGVGTTAAGREPLRSPGSPPLPATDKGGSSVGRRVSA